jgi:hypothetical protein
MKKGESPKRKPAIEAKGKDHTGRNPRYRISEDEVEIIKEYRRIHNEAVDQGIDPKSVKHGWIKSDNSSLFFKNPNYGGEKDKRDEFEKNLLQSIKDYAPKYPKIKRGKTKDGHLLIIDIADLHINKYAETFLTGAEYNSNLAVERALSGTKGLLKKSSGFNIDKILFVIGNDVLNIDNSFRQTTKGTPQDTDINWFTAFNIAKDCYVKCIEMCMSVADVSVVHCPSNHDYISGCFLAETLSAWFRNSKNITFDTTPRYRKYFSYHSNMIELEHGDKGKMQNLPLVMAQEEPVMWSQTKFRYGYLHHIHHSDKTQFKSAKDYVGVNITYLRSPSSADLWHYENQYINLVAVEGFVHSKDMGRVSHLTHYF